MRCQGRLAPVAVSEMGQQGASDPLRCVGDSLESFAVLQKTLSIFVKSFSTM